MKPVKMKVDRIKYYYKNLSYSHCFIYYELNELRYEVDANVTKISRLIYSQVGENINETN